MAWIFFVIFLAIVVLDAGVIASWTVQRSTSAHSPNGPSFRVRLQPTGVNWAPWAGMNGAFLTATIEWIRYLRSSERRWTVAVVRGTARYAPVIQAEEFQAWKRARQRVADIAMEIERGDLRL